jgi:hypothetical protein
MKTKTLVVIGGGTWARCESGIEKQTAAVIFGMSRSATCSRPLSRKQ